MCLAEVHVAAGLWMEPAEVRVQFTPEPSASRPAGLEADVGIRSRNLRLQIYIYIYTRRCTYMDIHVCIYMDIHVCIYGVLKGI